MRGSERPSLCWRETTSPPAARSRFSAVRRAPCNPGGPVAAACVQRSSESSRLRPSRKPDKNLDTSSRDEQRVRLALSSVPSGLTYPSPIEDWLASWHRGSACWGDVDDAVRGYLAARLFGNWIAYYGQGLHTIVEYLHVALAVLKMEAVRHHAHESASPPWPTVTEAVRSADLLLVHLADTRTLARLLDAKPPA